MNTETRDAAEVIAETLSDGSIAWNVEYRDARGYPIMTAGCRNRSDAEMLAYALNETSWVQVDCGETL